MGAEEQERTRDLFSFAAGWFIIRFLLRGGYEHGALAVTHMLGRQTVKFYKVCSCYNSHQYSGPDSDFQVPIFPQWFKAAVYMNDSKGIRISASSLAFLFCSVTGTSPLRFCCVQTCLWWKDLYLRLEIQRHMVNVRAGQQSRVIDSGLVYQLSDRADLIFFFYYFILSLGLHWNIITLLTMPMTADLYP